MTDRTASPWPAPRPGLGPQPGPSAAGITWTVPSARLTDSPRPAPSLIVAGRDSASVLPPLRPLRPLQMIDGAFALLRARPRQLMTIAVVFVIPPQLAVAFLQRQALSGVSLGDMVRDPTTSDASSGSSTWLFLAAFALSSLSLPFVTAAVGRVVVADRTGIVITTRDAISLAGRRWWALLASWALVHLAYVPGLFCFFVPIVLLMGVFIVVAPVVAMEQLGPVAAIKRSWTLCKRRYGACLGVGILSGLVIYILELALSAVPSVLSVVTLGRWAWLLDGAVGAATALVTTPLVATCTVLLYIDLRVRTEGLDMELDRRRVFGA